MDFVIPQFMPAAPEMFVLGAACLILALDVYLPERYQPFTYTLSQAALIVAAISCIVLYPAAPQVTFYGTFVSDSMSAVLKIFILLVTYFAFFYLRAYLLERNQLKGEYFVLGLFAVLGMMVLVSAHSLLTVYLGLELLSLCLYSLVALNRDSLSGSEAAMKYFVLGALASGMLLYGMSLIYGVAGTLDLAEIRNFVAGQQGDDIILVMGLVFVLVGIAFKLGAVPFHMWVPDVYEGAPTPVTLFDGLPGLREDWTSMLAILAVLSMGIGNIVAIAQTNLKRMLAYSTIAHVGFLFLGIIAGSASGYAASMFYIITYALMSMGGFGMIIWLGRSGFEADRLEDFKGLNDRNPWFAFLMLILMLSMAGVPPFVGFWAKWSVLREVIAAGSTWLAVVGVAFAIIGLFYYLRVVRLMYFEKPDEPLPVQSSSEMRVMMSTNALAILALGVYPGGLLALCVQALPG
jgi:NADH-quinone oxidoreductase subunit N